MAVTDGFNWSGAVAALVAATAPYVAVEAIKWRWRRKALRLVAVERKRRQGRSVAGE